MRRKDGVSSAEYAVLAMFILVAVASGVALLGDLTTDLYAAASRALDPFPQAASPPDGVSAAADGP
jgi:Flp pilus assembly pilin Flp